MQHAKPCEERLSGGILENGQLFNIRRSVRYFIVLILFCIFLYHIVSQYKQFQQHITLRTEQYTDNFEYPDSTFCVFSADFNAVASHAVASFIGDFFNDRTMMGIQKYQLLTDLFNITVNATRLSSVAMAMTALLRSTALKTYSSLYVRFIQSLIPSVSQYYPHDFILSCSFEGVPCDFRDFKPAKERFYFKDCFTFPSEDILKRRLQNSSYQKVREKKKGLQVILRTPGVTKTKSESFSAILSLLKGIPASKNNRKLQYATRLYETPRLFYPAVYSYLHAPGTVHSTLPTAVGYKTLLTTTYSVTNFESLPDVSDASKSRCVVQAPLLKPMKNSVGSFATFRYSQTLCHNRRVYDFVLKKCGCRLFEMISIPLWWNASVSSKRPPPCWSVPVKFLNPSQTISYRRTHQTMIFINAQGRVIGALRKNSTYERTFKCSFTEGLKIYPQRPGAGKRPCPLLCSTIRYRRKDLPVRLEFSSSEANDLLNSINQSLRIASRLDLPSSELTLFSKNLDPKLLVTGRMSNELVKVSLAPEKFRVHTIREAYAYPVVSLLSDVGGIIGLWLGVSAVTFADIIGWGLNWCISWRYSYVTRAKVSGNEAIAPQSSEADAANSEVPRMSDVGGLGELYRHEKFP